MSLQRRELRMSPRFRRALPVGLLLAVVVLSGCASFASDAGNQTRTGTDPTTTPATTGSATGTDTTPSERPTATTAVDLPRLPPTGELVVTDACNVKKVNFYGPPPYDFWSPEYIEFGMETVGPADVFIVASENGRVLGTQQFNRTRAWQADGGPIDLSVSLHGEHTIRLSVFEDTNGNDRFDPSEDALCRTEDGVVREVGTFDFDRVANSTDD